MRVNHIIADLTVSDIPAAKAFYTDFLGLDDGGLDLGWVARFTAPDDPSVAVQLVTHDEGAPVNPAVSVLVEDVDEAYAEAQAKGVEIVHPLTTEAWGVRRFFVRAPDGNVFNIVGHRRL
jgi:catechol 2,3-dioxygenase-like lactoylglutathione lyase family enzyme